MLWNLETVNLILLPSFPTLRVSWVFRVLTIVLSCGISYEFESGAYAAVYSRLDYWFT